jgi:hypothetical protein
MKRYETCILIISKYTIGVYLCCPYLYIVTYLNTNTNFDNFCLIYWNINEAMDKLIGSMHPTISILKITNAIEEHLQQDEWSRLGVFKLFAGVQLSEI